MAGHIFLHAAPWERLQNRPRASTEAARNVVLGPLVLRHGEYLLGLAEFDEVAHQEERAFVADARGLLHIVRDDDDGVA